MSGTFLQKEISLKNLSPNLHQLIFNTKRSRSSRRWYIPAAVPIYSTKKLNKLAGKPRRRFSAYSLNVRQLQGFTTENRPAKSHVFS